MLETRTVWNEDEEGTYGERGALRGGSPRGGGVIFALNLRLTEKKEEEEEEDEGQKKSLILTMESSNRPEGEVYLDGENVMV